MTRHRRRLGRIGDVLAEPREHGVDAKARSFGPFSHVVSLIYAQLTHSVGLNDVCDGLRHHAGKLATIRGAVAPARNTT